MPAESGAPPPEVMEWLHETYDDEGVEIWLTGWRKANPERRAFLERLAHMDGMGHMSARSVTESAAPDYHVSKDPAWQPYRDPDTGEVVTLTPKQCSAIFRALDVWLAVAAPGPSNEFLRDAVQEAKRGLGVINMKSCLMARLLYDGKAPLVDAPPTVAAAPDYSLEVPDDPT